jgi:hypothetical protein
MASTPECISVLTERSRPLTPEQALGLHYHINSSHAKFLIKMIIIQRQEIKYESLICVNKSKAFRVKLLNLFSSFARNINIRRA